MSSRRIVYHMKDKDLFGVFIRGLSHKVLLEPVRKDGELRNRYFKGYRISDHYPDKEALASAYYRELNAYDNNQLRNFLCIHWIEAHYDLSKKGLHSIGVDLSGTNWLQEAHEVLRSQGHIDIAKSIARSLAISYPSNEILIFLSILSYEHDDQEALRKVIQDHISLTQSDPSVLRDHLQNQLGSVTSRRVSLKKLIDETKSQSGNKETIANQQSEELRKVLIDVESELQSSGEQLTSARKELETLNERIKEQNAKAIALKQRKEKVENQIDYISKTFREEMESDHLKLTRLEADYEEGKREEDRLRAQIKAVEARIREEMSMAGSTVSGASKDQVTVVERKTSSLAAVEWTEGLLEDIYDVLSFSSCLTLELVWLRFAKLIGVGSELKKPEVDFLTNPVAWRDYYARQVLNDERPWDRGGLAWYAWLRTLTPTQESRETLVDFAVSGLYHAARSNDENVIDLLLGRLLELWAGTSEINQNPDRFSKEALDTLEERGNNPERSRFLGLIQAKLASASPQALNRLYDLLPSRPRIIAKRGLVSHLSGFGLNEKDPGYEMLDVICTTIGSSTAPLVGNLRSWCRRASLQTIVNERQTPLRATSKLSSLFSAESQRRIELFRDLIGRQLSEAISQNTPESYAVLNKRCVDFIDADLKSPEWISSRYLFPLVVELARCGSNADVEIRRTLRAEIVVALEKGQHPIGSVPRDISVGIQIANRGTAPADNVTLAVMAARGSEPNVELKNAESRIPRLPVGGDGYCHELTVNIVAPSPVIELEYLVTWNDPSAHDRSEVGKLKLTAQRAVDWEKAKVNPYSLRSITDPNRLHGRENVLDRLRIGIMGLQSFYLTGQRRVGKSSVARVLYNEFQANDAYIPVYVTLGELTTTSVGAMMYSLQKALAETVPLPLRGTVMECLPSEADFGREMGAAARSFQRTLEQYLPHRKFLCLIDDFDELGQNLYKGADSDALFLYFRTLIDRGTFSFVFVGSERLPEILRRHGERLNQVKRVNLDYLDNIAGLVKDPASPYLEFSDEAVSFIYKYSAGNPYYATQICLRLYEDMVLRRDHYVGAADVQKSVDSIVNEESVSTFQHFWKDGVFEGGADIERLQQVNAALLIASAGMEGTEQKPVRRVPLLESASLTRYDQPLLKFQLDNLIERRVIEGREESLHLRVPLLGMWLRGVGSAAVQSSFGERDLEVALTPIRVGVGERDILEVCKDLVYQEREVSEILIKAWLEQFGGRREQELVFCLLRRLKEEGYFSAAKIYTTFKRIHSLIIAEQGSSGQWAQLIKKGRTSNIFVTCVDREGKSGGSLLYYYRQANQIPSNLVGSMEDAADFLKNATRPTVVIFVDDFIGSGGTCVESSKRFHSLVPREQLETVGHLLCVAALLGIRAGAAAVEAETDNQYRVFLGEELASRHRAFSPESGIFSSEKDRLEAEALCRSIGEVLEAKHPLGYGDCQALVTFPHRCPNNTLPIFHKVGKFYHGREWVPLFPR